MQTLLASDGAGEDRFGRSVAVHNGVVIVGADGDNNEKGIDAGVNDAMMCVNIVPENNPNCLSVLTVGAVYFYGVPALPSGTPSSAPSDHPSEG